MAAVPRTRVVVDIETIGVRWEELSEPEQEYLTRRSAHEDPDVQRYAAQDRLALSPLTGEIVAIGLLNPDTGKGRIHLFLPPGDRCGDERGVTTGKNYEFLGVRPDIVTVGWDTEAAALKASWADLQKYDQIISFHGRVFDGPFLMIRSMANGVPIGRNLAGNRYDDAHIDLKDRLSFFGINPSYSLDFWCRRLGIPSPKEGMKGPDVQVHWREGDIASICTYLAGDLRATAELFRKYAAAFLQKPEAK